MWNISEKKQVPMPDTIKAFLDAYVKLCEEFGMCLGHEDSQGAFIVEDFDEGTIAWVRAAQDNTTRER